MAWYKAGGSVPDGTINTTPKTVSQTVDVTDYEYNNVGPIYEDIATSEAMDAVLVDDNDGKMYRYIGTTTSKYTKDRLYVVHKKITDLTGTTWVLSLNAGVGSSNTYNINYTSNGTSFSSLFAPFKSSYPSYYYGITQSTKGQYTYTYQYGMGSSRSSYGFYTVIKSGSSSKATFTSNAAYQTISITGGTDATNTTLIEWLYANATLQE